MCMKRGFLLWVIMEIWRWGREGKEYNRYVGRYVSEERCMVSEERWKKRDEKKKK